MNPANALHPRSLKVRVGLAQLIYRQNGSPFSLSPSPYPQSPNSPSSSAPCHIYLPSAHSVSVYRHTARTRGAVSLLVPRMEGAADEEQRKGLSPVLGGGYGLKGQSAIAKGEKE